MPHPTIDPRWGYDETKFPYEAFAQRIDSTFYLKDEVHPDVQAHWKVIQSLVELSYYQYEFLDLANLKALLSLEMAMKLRHKEISNSDSFARKTMKPLLYWFFSRGYFETDHEEFIDRIDWMRNHHSHPTMHSFGGPFTAHNIYSPLNMINDLYEDRDLRKQRNKIWDRLQPLFDQIKQDGGQITWEDGKVDVIYYAATEFINNKKSPVEIHIVCRTPFALPDSWKPGDSCEIQPPLNLSFYETEFDYHFIKGKMIDSGKSFVLSSKLDETHAIEFANWKNSYSDYARATAHSLAITSSIYSRGHELIKAFYLNE